MSLIKVTKELSFDAAHRIPDHAGKCKNMHGHTYRVQVTIGLPLCEFNQADGMVMDFSDLSLLVRPMIDQLDHSLIVSEHDPLKREVQSMGIKVITMAGPPTAENMAIDIGMKLEEKMKPMSVILCSVRVWETPTSFAEYEGQGGNPCQTCESQ